MDDPLIDARPRSSLSLLYSGLRREIGTDVDQAQVDGVATSDSSIWPATVTPYLDTLPVWNDFTLRQLDPDSFTIWKRINGDGSWLKKAGHGTRASGVGYIGGATGGGIQFSQRNFWQMAPRCILACSLPFAPSVDLLHFCLSSCRSINIANAGTDAADVTLWAYSPAGDAMDLRHYSTIDHEFVPILHFDVLCGPHLNFFLHSRLNLAYEDNPDPSVTSTPVGMARSYEVLFFNFSCPYKEDAEPFFLPLSDLSPRSQHHALP